MNGHIICMFMVKQNIHTYIYIYIYIRENPNLIMLRTNKQINGEIATQEHKTRQNKGV